jgi:hypothetical protein
MGAAFRGRLPRSVHLREHIDDRVIAAAEEVIAALPAAPARDRRALAAAILFERRA